MFGPPQVPSVAAAEVPPDAVVLDVRGDDEWAAGRIDGALHVPLHQLVARLGEVPAEAEVVVVCRVGSRSAQAVAWLNALGRATVNLDGGMRAWAAAGRPMVADSGAPRIA